MSAPAPPTGWEFRVRRVEGAPLVAVRAWLRGGARAEAVPGQCYLTGRLLAEGTRRRDWRTLAEATESRGMVLTGTSGFETHAVALDALAGDWALALDWLAEILLEPAFPADRAALLCRQARAELASLADQADATTARAFLDQLYSPHPRGRPLQGTEESLATLTPEHAAEHHRRALGWGGVLTVAGLIDEAAVAERLAGLAAALPAGGDPLPEPPAPPATPLARREIVTRGHDQAHLFLGRLTVDQDDPELPALALLGIVLGAGSGLAGRIPTRIREREGLAYTATAETAAGAARDRGRLVCYLGTSPATLSRAEAAVREELARLVAEGPTPAEVEEARSYLLGREPFRRETARQWANLLATAALTGKPVDDPAWVIARLRGVTHSEVAAACRYLDPSALAVTVGLPVTG
ncbi:MAG: insulinase family protein [Acidobacteria bacterium]|nr:insulinase family protein [Thermoanaerobaculia bacterium]NLN10715.1 insulinase family protein [Acidobacteriota bacterium]HNZ96216.1 pitrilysin family protein [Thermoanaerobaculia bacterium]HPA96319.1 pitrilysin family protein [Thermoanaerobaculia bacterium]HRR12853.1 pitrilysin family protein [Thermoanaerobaculia bacterium]